MRQIIYKGIAWLHLWLGIASGIIVVVLSLTGCVLTFKEEILHCTQSWRRVAPQESPMLAPSLLGAAVEKQLPGFEVSSIWYHGLAKSAVVTINADSNVFVNPYSAEVIAIKDHDLFFEFIADGHYHMWLPEDIAHPVIGSAMIIFVFLLISGLIMWWPKRWNKKNSEKSFQIKWKARFKRLNYDLHNVLGFYSMLLALLIGLTALIMLYPWFSGFVFTATGGKPMPKKELFITRHSSEKTNIMEQVDKAWRLGLDSLAQFNKDAIIIEFPHDAEDPIYVCVDMYRGNWRNVYLDQNTLALLPETDKRMQDMDFANWLRKNNYALHTGYVYGFTTKVIYFLTSLICATLPITGFYIWWGRRKKKKIKIN